MGDEKVLAELEQMDDMERAIFLSQPQCQSAVKKWREEWI